MNAVPRSVGDKTGGMLYFARMLDKIRLFAAGELKADYHANLGGGTDAACLDFLRIPYDALQDRVRAGGTDAEILEWCFGQGRRLNKNDVRVWNGFVAKRGWRDSASPVLAQSKQDSGLADRDDIQTFPDYFEVDEGRRP